MPELTFEEIMATEAEPPEVVSYNPGDGGWGFYDETWSEFYRSFPTRNKPFKNRKEAEKGLKKYCDLYLV